MLTARPMCRQGSNSRQKLCNSSRNQRGSQPSTAPTSHQLQLLVANVCGLLLKMEELRHVMLSLLPDVIPETKITSDKCFHNDIMIPGYFPRLWRDRTSHGSGVAVWVKSGTAYQYLESIQCYDHEVLWLSVAAKNNGHFVAGAVYRPSSCHGDTQLLDYLDTTINESERYGSHIVIAGDFNIHKRTFTAQTGKRSSHPAQILPAPESLTISFLECTNSFPQKCSPLAGQTRSSGLPNVRSQ